MLKNENRPVYDLKAVELCGVAATVGSLHYASSLVQNFNDASTVSGALHSADVGITAAAGVLAYCAYRYFFPKAPKM